MKNLILTLMVLLVAIGVAASMVGGTFASFSDIEISEGNYFGTAALDLKVAKCGCDFNDDPYVEPCFEIHIHKGNTCEPNCGCGSSYFCQLTLWNAAQCEGDQCEHGIAYLHIKNVEGCLADDLLMKVERWDCNGKNWACCDDCWVVVKGWTKIGCLDCQQIELFNLYASETQKVRIGIWLPLCSQGDSVEWDMAFELLADGFSDIETSHNYLTKGCKWEGCSTSFWKTHEDKWPDYYDPSQHFDAIFSNGTFVRNAFDHDVTLMEALGLGGGGQNSLAREAVAALLNAAHPDMEYALTVGEVITRVQDAIASGEYEDTTSELAAYNSFGCSLDK
jgi:predicted ribosomally synthesized peptide with SipW-like signal peptide